MRLPYKSPTVFSSPLYREREGEGEGERLQEQLFSLRFVKDDVDSISKDANDRRAN